MTQNVFDDRREDGHGQKGDKHFDDRPDRVTGAEYSAVVLAEDGTLKRGLYGSDEAANELACYVRDHNLSAGTASKVVSLDSGTYAISIQADPVEADSLLLIYTPTFEMNDGTLTITMGAGDTDGVDSNGNIIINGGTINVTGQSSFDCDGTAQYNGGTIIVNGQQVDSIPNQMMGGGMGGGNFGGGMGGFGGGRRP